MPYTMSPADKRITLGAYSYYEKYDAPDCLLCENCPMRVFFAGGGLFTYGCAAEGGRGVLIGSCCQLGVKADGTGFVTSDFERRDAYLAQQNDRRPQLDPGVDDAPFLARTADINLRRCSDEDVFAARALLDAQQKGA